MFVKVLIDGNGCFPLNHWFDNQLPTHPGVPEASQEVRRVERGIAG